MKQQQPGPRPRWRTAFITISFLAWSALMILAGNVFTDFGMSRSQAATASSLVKLDPDRLAGNNLGEYSPYDPDAGNLMARGHEFYYSEDENFGLGVWESQPGETTYTDLGYDELMYVLEGAIVMTDAEGNIEKIGPGEGLVLPTGYSGTLAVPDGGVRKIWVTYMGGEKK